MPILSENPPTEPKRRSVLATLLEQVERERAAKAEPAAESAPTGTAPGLSAEPAPAPAPVPIVDTPATESAPAMLPSDATFGNDDPRADERSHYKDGRPEIFVTHPILIQVHQALTDLHGHLLVNEDDHSIVVTSNEGARVFRVSKPMLRGLMERFSAFIKWNKTEEAYLPSVPPAPVVDAAFERGDYPELQPFRGLRFAAYVGTDGLVRSAKGYDPSTGIIQVTPDLPAMPEHVSRADALSAAAFIRDEVLHDFPLTGVGLSVCLSAMISTFARPFIGPTPAHLFDAPVQGAGKTMLSEIAAAIGLGREISPIAFRSNPDEFSKSILSALLPKPPVLVFDNVTAMGGTELAAMLTSRSGRMKVRILGKLESVEVWCECVILASGNSIEVDSDLGRRVLWARLDPEMENPDTRTGFKHDPLKPWVTANLTSLHHAIAIMWEAFRQAGRPRSGRPLLGSFEGWSMHVRDLLLWLGMADPCESRELTAERDPDREFLRTLLPALERLDVANVGLTTTEIADAARNPKNADLADALGQFRTPAGHLNTKAIGKRFARLRGRVVAGMRLWSPPALRHNQRTWAAERMAERKAATPAGAAS